MPRWGPGRLIRYGDSIVRSPCGCGDRVAQPEGSIARMLDGDDASVHFRITQRARSDTFAAKGRAVRFRCLPTKSGRTEATDASDHAATRKVGGARIGCPRAKVSTMIIAAPQCGQTKVG